MFFLPVFSWLLEKEPEDDLMFYPGEYGTSYDSPIMRLGDFTKNSGFITVKVDISSCSTFFQRLRVFLKFLVTGKFSWNLKNEQTNPTPPGQN